jgi:uroporphyrinogen decarboxylase
MKDGNDPDFERLRKTLLLQGMADRVPLFDFCISENIKEQIIGRPLKTAEDEIDFWITAGYDYVQARLKPKTASDRGVARPVSSSHGRLKSLEQLNSEEFEWTKVYNNSWKLEDYNYELLRQIAHKLPQDMKLIVHAADIFTRSWMAMGFEDFCYALYEQPELVAELFRQNAAAEIRMMEVMADSFGDKTGAVLYSDDLAYTEGLMVSPQVYREYLWPYVREIIKIAKKLNAPVIYHTDGKLWDLFDDFYELGINGIQPLEPKSMDLAELKEKRGHQFCLLGSIDIDLLSRGTPYEVEEMVKERIKTLGYNGGYVVGTSNTVPDYVNINNYKAMLKTAMNYRPLA